MQRFGRAILFALAFAILYSGPVAACVCAGDQPMSAMPCCPDQADHAGQHDLGMPASLDTACGPVAVSLLPAGVQDVPAIVAPEPAPEPWRNRAPPPLPAIAPRPPLDTPPIYLVTLRLRN
jgi:hypothetical protein